MNEFKKPDDSDDDIMVSKILLKMFIMFSDTYIILL